VPEDDLIESAPLRPPSALRRWAQRILGRPAVGAALLVIGLIAGSLSGYILGQQNPPELGGIYAYFRGFEQFPVSPLTEASVDPAYGRTPIPTLTAEDLAALGENVTRQFSVLSGRSAIPVLCATSVGQPGSTSEPGTGYPSTVFQVRGAEITQLIWSHPDAAAASGALRTLISQAVACPDVPNLEMRVTTSGQRYGIGDEYAFFYRRPLVADSPEATYAVVVLVRVGADLIEIALANEDAIGVDEGRCYRVAEVAARRAAGG
jgi:hypothetical protein